MHKLLDEHAPEFYSQNSLSPNESIDNSNKSYSKEHEEMNSDCGGRESSDTMLDTLSSPPLHEDCSRQVF